MMHRGMAFSDRRDQVMNDDTLYCLWIFRQIIVNSTAKIAVVQLDTA